MIRAASQAATAAASPMIAAASSQQAAKPVQRQQAAAAEHPDAKAGPLARAHHLQLREPHLAAGQLANLPGQVLNKVRGRTALHSGRPGRGRVVH
jgi:hypothetical protein